MLLALAFAWPMQGGGGVQNAHYVLVKALANGTPEIEKAMTELGDYSTNDFTVVDGKTYSNKAPGLAFLTLPVYGALELVGARTVGDPARALWALGLVGVVLPAALLLVVVRRLADSFVPGYGLAAAVAIGAGTLLLPYATLFFSHVLAAALLFGAFAILVRERRRDVRLWIVGAAGVLAGYAVTTEYPSAVGVAVLGLYALAGTDRVRRAAAYAAGALVGALPLLLYNAWAFGSPFESSYSTSPEGEATNLFGSPRVGAMLDLLRSSGGLVVLAPVLACAAVGTVALARRARAEALAIGALCVGYVVFTASFYSPYGGTILGPRYLIPIVPFLSLGLAIALRARPLITGALALMSVGIFATITATHALAGYNRGFVDRLLDRETTATAASLVGITGWYAIVPFLLAVVGAVAGAALATSWEARTLELPAVAAALAAWVVVWEVAPSESVVDYGRFAVVALVAAAAIAVALVVRGRVAPQLPLRLERT